MLKNNLQVKLLSGDEIPLIVDYWTSASPEFLKGMGADPQKIPTKNDLSDMLQNVVAAPFNEKKALATIWFINGIPSGHCNVNAIEYGKSAFMHLHLWKGASRKKGFGSTLVKMSIPFFFEHLSLQLLYSEPYALNPAPNKTLDKIGFTFEKRHRTIPGSLNFEQEVNRWSLTKEDWAILNKK